MAALCPRYSQKPRIASAGATSSLRITKKSEKTPLKELKLARTLLAEVRKYQAR